MHTMMLVFFLVLQMPPAPPEGWDKVGIVTVLVIAVFVVGTAFLREWVVPGARYKAKEEECNAFREENNSLRADNMTLWREKVDDAREAGELARLIRGRG